MISSHLIPSLTISSSAHVPGTHPLASWPLVLTNTQRVISLGAEVAVTLEQVTLLATSEAEFLPDFDSGTRISAGTRSLRGGGQGHQGRGRGG